MPMKRLVLLLVVVAFLLLGLTDSGDQVLSYAFYFSQNGQSVKVPDSNSLTQQYTIYPRKGSYLQARLARGLKNLAQQMADVYEGFRVVQSTIRGLTSNLQPSPKHYLTGKIPKPLPQHYRTGKIPKTAATETTGEIAMTWTGYMRGTTDEVRIWDAARTEDEILAQMYTESIGNELPLVTYWDFNVGSSNTVLTDRYDGTNVEYGSDAAFVTGAHTPEPATLLLVSSGLIGIAAFRRKFKK